MLSIKYLVFKERLIKKLIKRYMRFYVVEEIMSKNIVKLELLASMRTHLVVNISRIVKYREPVKGQRIEGPKLVEIDRVKE